MSVLQNERVLILGASSGVGRAAAVLFAQAGARVLAAARRAERLSALAKEIKIETAVADAGSHASMEALAETAQKKLGGVDTLVYATGTNTPDRAMKRLNRAIWNELIEVNLNGAYSLTAALLPAMREAGKGHFIYVSSISGKYGDVSGAAYQASKRGMLGLAAAVRAEEKENGIRTCVVCPGLIDTELMEKRPVKPDAATLGKALQAEDVAQMIFAVACLPQRAAVVELEIVPTMI
jgi:NADP-dependent 3-hydroxy acid dehydrogenase YdfG